MIRVCFVCLGNICRSPTAEGIFLHLIREAGIADQFFVASAGTSGWHVGEIADARSRREASRRGFELESRSDRFVSRDFDRFDQVVAMDAENLSDLRKMCREPGDRDKLSLLRDHEPDGPGGDVPDPYYGEGDGFREVFDICEAACRGFLEGLRRDHEL